MKLKTIVSKLTAIAMGVVMTATMPFASVVSLASSPSQLPQNITQQTIPVVATTDGYYLISYPANLDGSGNLNLTKDNNAYVTSQGDTANTFYGYAPVGVQGSIAEGKHVHVDLSCADLVKTGDTSSSAVVGMQNLSAEQGTKVTNIWSTNNASVKATNAVSFGETTWTPGTTGINMNFEAAKINATTDTTQYAMLRTTLPGDGTYTSNLILDFSVVTD